MKSTNIVKLITDAPSLIQVNGVWVPKKVKEDSSKIFKVLETYVEDGKMITKKELDSIKKEFQNG